MTAQKPRSHRISRTVSALMVREMSTTYGRTAFGYLWAILEPAAGILLLTLVFSLALRAPGLGTNFPLYYASGLLPFLAFFDLSSKISGALRFSKPLLTLPAVTYIDAIIARLLLNSLTQLMVISVVVTLIIMLYQLDVHIDFAACAFSLGMAIFLGLSVGTMNSFLFLTFPFWERMWNVVTRPMFFMSCVFFLFESVPLPFRDYLWYNPLVHIVGQFRKGIFVTYSPDYVSPKYVLGISLCLLAGGLLLLKRHHLTLLDQ